jgi:CRISPR/Cas system-associated exonuclease Cas4 (RecB family)
MNHSYSSISLYSQCPRAWYVKQVLRVEEKPNAASNFGMVVHSAIEGMFKGAPIANSVSSAVEHAALPVNEQDVLTNAVSIPQQCTGDDRHAEEWLRMPLPGCDWPMVMKIDLWYKEGAVAYVWDWKTGKPYRPDKQVALYAWAVMEAAGVDVVSGHLYFTKYGQDEARQFTRKDVKKAVEWASAVGQEIEQHLALVQVGGMDVLQAFPHKFCRECQWCSEQQTCYQNMEQAA